MSSKLRVVLERMSFSLDVDLEWDERVMVFFGPSGSGKTSLFEAALGLIPDAQVSLCLGGHWLEDPARSLRLACEARDLGWVPQDPTLFPHLNVLGNLRFGMGRAADAGPKALERAIDVLEIGGLLERGIDQLSGGERQRVALARAIASGPRALLLDEPLAALDLGLRARVLPYLLRVRDELGLPMLYITHDPDEAILLGERVAVLNAGRVVASGPPREVLWSQAVLPLSQTLGLENVFEAEQRSGPEGARLVTRAGLELQTPWRLEAGQTLWLGLRAEDITLSLDPPGRISARNVIAGRIIMCEQDADDVLVHVDAGERLVVRITPNAARALALEPGMQAHLIVKAHALRRLG